MKFVKIFVYGTLKVGGYYSKQVDEYRHSSEIATLRGTLFSAEYFPVLIKKGNNIIYGELHVYKNPKTVLSIIDRIEGFIGKYEETEGCGLDGECLAYVYFFAHNINGMKQIKNGKWKI